jgi:hypothetical protein
MIEFWTSKISQPKHLVLTQKNFPVLTHDRVTDHTENLAAMRRRKSFEGVRGGCVSVEITNEGSGWHLHSHWLLDVDWLDMKEVSRDWADLVGQSFSVCKVMDCRDRSYITEISKYVVEGSELAKWPAEQVNEFVLAVRGLRFFFSFGALYKLGPRIREEIAALEGPPKECDCGETDFVYETEQDVVLHEIRELDRRKRRR